MSGGRVAVAAAILTAGLGLLPAGAGAAQDSGGLLVAIGFPVDGTPVAQFELPVSFDGQVTETFHGDAAAGCGAAGTCGYSGTVYWRPPSAGLLAVDEIRRHGRISLAATLGLGGAGSDSGTTTARVSWRPANGSPPSSSCNDARTQLETDLASHGNNVVVSLAGSDVLATRCAGPRTDDVLRLLSPPRVGLHSLRQPTVDLRGIQSFAGHGFAGTLVSTVRMRVGRPESLSPPEAKPPRVKPVRVRDLEVTYRAEVVGDVGVDFAGSRDASFCLALGSCGAGGHLRWVLEQHHLQIHESVLANEARPVQDLLAAAHLSTHGHPGGLDTAGFASWDSGGNVTETLAQFGQTCRDQVPGPPASILFTFSGARAVANLSGGYENATTLRTRCPGPDTGTGELADGSAPARLFTRRVVTIPLRTGTSFLDDGYSVTTAPHLTLRLTRQRVHMQTFSFPAG